MDVSIVAALSSFIVSERVIKAKATVLLILLGVICYDLTIHSNDPSSLRVYRGPALTAIALIVVAFSLRTWRRNGVACDELLFLPGTPHAEKHGIVEPTTIYNDENTNNANGNPDIIDDNGFIVHLNDKFDENNIDNNAGNDDSETRPMLSVENIYAPDNKDVKSIPAPSNREFWCVKRLRLRRSNINKSLTLPARRTSLNRFFSSLNASDNNEFAPSGPSVASAALDLFLPVMFNFHLFMMASSASKNTDVPPQILHMIFLSILILRIIFPPKSRWRFWGIIRYTLLAPFYSVTFRDAFIGDLLTSMVRPLQDICFGFVYYFVSWYAILSGKIQLKDSGDVLTQSKILHNVILPLCAALPLCCKFLQCLRQAYDTKQRLPHFGNAFKYFTSSIVVFYAMVYPEGKRTLWWVLSFILTLFYQIWWDIFIDWELLEVVPPINHCNNTTNNNNREEILEKLSDNSSTNNLFLTSSHQEKNYNKPLTVEANNEEQEMFENEMRIQNFIENLLNQLPINFRLRSKRLYKSESYYWRLLWINVILRFTWMLAFIPTYHLRSGRINYTFSSDVKAIGGFFVALAEIIRRCCWGILKLELETIKMTNGRNSDKSFDFSLSGFQQCFVTSRSTTRPTIATVESTVQYQFLTELCIWCSAYVGILYFFFFS